MASSGAAGTARVASNPWPAGGEPWLTSGVHCTLPASWKIGKYMQHHDDADEQSDDES